MTQQQSSTVTAEAHTPTPWKVDEGYPGSGPWDRQTIGTDEIVVTVVNRMIPAGAANAAFIVKAVNSHDALVKALEIILNDTHGIPDWEALEQCRKLARAALSQVQP